MNIPVIIEKEEDGRYRAVFPTLPGCFTDGETREELMHNIHEAIDCYLGDENVNVAEQKQEDVEVLNIAYPLAPA